MPNDPKGPQSPDNLGVHGRVEGVTRIGGRAIAIGVVVLGVLIAGIFYGLNSGGKSQQTAQISSMPPTAAPQNTPGAHFGADVPIVETPPPDTPPPAVILPPSPPPLAQESASAAPVVAATGPSVAEQAEERRLEEERQRELDAEKAREDELKRANQAPILASVGNGSGGAFGGGGGAPAGPAGASGYVAAGGAVGGATGAVGAAGATGPGGSTGAVGATGASGAGGIGGAGGAGGAGAAGTAGGAAGSAGGPAGQGTSSLGFLGGPTGQYASQSGIQQGTGMGTNDLRSRRYSATTIFELLAGSVIPAELVTGIDSELPGFLTGQVREDVYDTKSGKYLLIPKGTRLIGLYQSQAGFGGSRVLVAWQRLIFPDTSSIDLLNMTGNDVQGGGGLGGKVDNHTGTLIFGTLLSSVLAAGLALSQPTTTAVATTTSGTVAVPSQGALAAQAVGAQLGQTTQGLIQKTLNEPPTIYVPKGYPFLVIVDRDMIFPGPYGPSL